MKPEDLPHQVKCPDCDNPHFLTINRDCDGQWSLGYVEFENHSACVFVNEAATLKEGATRMHYALERYKRRVEQDEP